jgi:hypothetical protein
MRYLIASVNWSGIGHVLAASLPVVISVVVTYIAWQQYEVNRRQHRLALFEKRLAVFDSTMNMIVSVVQSANPTLPECLKYIRETRDHEFLFGPEVGTFIDEVFKKATALHAHVQVGVGGAAQQTEIMTWFIGRTDEARKVFRPYLDFRKP